MKRRIQTLGLGAALALAGLVGAGVVRGPGEKTPSPVDALLEVADDAPEADEVRWVEDAGWDLSVTYNDRVEFWIDFLKGRNADKTRVWLERLGAYGPMIRAELARRGMPEDLVYLAMIESGLSPKAYSHAHASGMWQFISETGQRYGLEVSRHVDERRDPVKATSAALDYLQDLHDRFGSWYLAAAAYNTGENRVGRVMRQRFGTERGTDAHFWQIDQRLPRETRDYVPLMLAAGHIGKNPEKYGFEGLVYQEPLAFDTVVVPGSVDLTLVAEASGVEEESVEGLNTHLMHGETPPGGAYTVRIPKGASLAFAQSFERLYAAAKAAEPEIRLASHVVRRGETLSHIAKRYGTTVAALQDANGGLNPRRLRAGVSVRVPVEGATTLASASTGSTASVYRVRSGDSLWSIARRNGVTVRELQAWNGMNGRSRIQPGQQLKIGG